MAVSAITGEIAPGAADLSIRLLADATEQGLVRFDAAGRIEPGLAESWIVIDEGTSYIFRLRPARWPDGTTVTSAQVAAALTRRLAARANPLRPFLTAVEGAVAMTPGDVRLQRSSKDLVITCAKEGYQTATVQQEPKFSGVTFGNFVLGGPVGFVVDAASGASFYYPSEVKLGLAPNPAFSPPLALDRGFDQPVRGAAGL